MKLFFCLFFTFLIAAVTFTESDANSLKEDQQLIQVGVGAFQDRFYDIAEKQFLAFVETFPEHAKILDVYCLLGKTLTIRGKLKEAKNTFYKIINSGKSFENMDHVFLCMAELELRLGNREEGRKYLQWIIKKYPKFDRIDYSYFLLGILEYGSNQRADSDSFLKKILHISKNNDLIYPSYFWLGLLSFKEKQFEIAAEYFRTILKNPNSIPAEYLKYALFWLGETQLRLGRINDAYSYFKTFYTQFNKGPLVSHAFWKIGFCEYQSGDLNKSIETFQLFKNRFTDSPLLPSVHFLLGYFLMMKGDYPSSIKELKLNYNLPRGDHLESASLLLLFLDYFRSGEFDDATRISQTLQKGNYSEDDKIFIQWLNAEVLYGGGSLQESLPYYFNILNTPFREKALYRIGKTYFFQSNFRESITNLDILFLEFPNSKYLSEGLFLKGECLVKLGHLDQGFEPYRLIVRQNQNNVWCLFALIQTGRLYLWRNDLNQFENSFLAVIDRFPGQPLSYYAALELGDLNLYKNNFTRAVYYYTTVFKGNLPGLFEEAYFGLGEIFYQQGKYEKALRCFEAILKDHQQDSPWFYLAYLEIGNLKKRSGEYEEAKNSYLVVLNQSKDEEMRQAAKILLEGLKL